MRPALLACLFLTAACSTPKRRPPPPGYYGPPPPGYQQPRPGYQQPPPGYQQPAPGPAQPLSQAEIEAGIDRAKPDIQGCFARVMMGNRGASGRVVVRFVIEPNGRVSTVEIKESSLDGRMNTCVTDVVRRLTYRAHGTRPQGVVYPISFN